MEICGSEKFNEATVTIIDEQERFVFSGAAFKESSDQRTNFRKDIKAALESGDFPVKVFVRNDFIRRAVNNLGYAATRDFYPNMSEELRKAHVEVSRATSEYGLSVRSDSSLS